MALPDNALLVNNVAGLDATPRSVVDKDGTESGLQLSTQNTRVTGSLEVRPASGAFGGGAYDALLIGNKETGAAGGIFAVRTDPSNKPFFTFVGYDGGEGSRTLYFGGGQWGSPDVNVMEFWTTDSLDETANTALMRLQIQGDGRVRFRQDAGSSGVQFITADGNESVTVRPSGTVRFAHLADSAAGNDSTYFSTDAGKLVYKDAGGVVNNLY